MIWGAAHSRAAELVNEVRSVVEQLAREGMKLILVTHEMRFARDVGTKLVFVHHGKVHEEGVCSQHLERRNCSSQDDWLTATRCSLIREAVRSEPGQSRQGEFHAPYQQPVRVDFLFSSERCRAVDINLR